MSWDTLLDIARENAAEAEAAASRVPTSCPHDGATLVANSDGALDCPMGNYRWDPITGPQSLDDGGVRTYEIGGW